MASAERELFRVPGACAECRRDRKKKQVGYRSSWPDKDLVVLEASKNGHLECVKACLAAGVDVREAWTRRFFSFGIHGPLYRAVEHSNEDCVEYLIEAGAKICKEVLRVAGARGSERCLNLILEAGGDANEILIGAASEGRPSIVELLITAGADVNTKYLCNKKVLFIAVSRESIQCVDQILKAGADVNFRDNEGETALFFAVRNGSVQCTDLLLQGGADVNIQNYLGRTVLFVAVRKDSVQCTDQLLKAGADVNIVDGNSQTALFYAFWNRSVECIDLLLQAGTDVNIQNKVVEQFYLMQSRRILYKTLICY